MAIQEQIAKMIADHWWKDWIDDRDMSDPEVPGTSELETKTASGPDRRGRRSIVRA